MPVWTHTHTNTHTPQISPSVHIHLFVHTHRYHPRSRRVCTPVSTHTHTHTHTDEDTTPDLGEFARLSIHAHIHAKRSQARCAHGWGPRASMCQLKGVGACRSWRSRVHVVRKGCVDWGGGATMHLPEHQSSPGQEATKRPASNAGVHIAPSQWQREPCPAPPAAAPVAAAAAITAAALAPFPWTASSLLQAVMLSRCGWPTRNIWAHMHMCGFTNELFIAALCACRAKCCTICGMLHGTRHACSGCRK